MDIAELEVKVKTDESSKEVDKLNKKLDETAKKGDGAGKKATQGFSRLSGVVSEARAAVGLLGAAFAAIGLGKILREFEQSELALVKLRGTLVGVGQASAEYERRLVGLASSIQATTRFADDQVIAVEQQLIMFGATAESIEGLTRLTLDYAEATGQDATSAAMLMGRALQGNFTMFSRYGFQIDNTKTKTEQLQDLFRQMEKRGIPGFSDRVGNSAVGALSQARNAFSDLLEEMGRLFMAGGGNSAINELIMLLRSLREAVEGVSSAMSKVPAFLKTNPIGSLSRGLGHLSAGDTQNAMDALLGLDTTSASSAAKASALPNQRVLPSSEDVDRATLSLAGYRNELELLAATSQTDAERIQHVMRWDKLSEEITKQVQVLEEAGKLTDSETKSLIELIEKAGDRQNELFNRAVELETMRARLLKGGTISVSGFSATMQGNASVRSELTGARAEAAAARTVETYEHAMAKIAILSADMARQMEFNLMSPIESFTTGWTNAVEQFGSLSQRVASVGESLATSIDQNLTDGLMGIIDGTKSVQQAFSEMANAIIQDLIRVMIQQLLVRSILKGFNLGGASTMHAGGIVGFGMADRATDPAFFERASKYESGGIAGDEVPIIAHRGEVIFNQDQFGALLKGMGGRQQRTEIINVTDPRMVDERLNANPSAILNVITKNRAAVKGALGISG